ncbi:MAG TPA: hypothetical protein PLL20_01030 [Phycisphaerae bacterium]|nr:hypothetical protein [Phycisphaerae bacterium]HRR84762.1 hypothetical protein [Phycisphaerae bacterium]
MASYPQTYQIARQGAVRPVTVGNDEDVIALRTELELMSSFAQGATPELVEALEDRLAAVKSGAAEEGGRTAEDIKDMVAILRDAMHPSTGEAIAKLDADFPTARGEIDMAAVEKESNDFHEDVGNEVTASGKPSAGRVGQAFKQAMLNKAVAARRAAPETSGVSETPASENASETGAASGQQPASAEPASGQQVPAESSAGTTESDPVEAALREAMGIAEGALAGETSDMSGVGDEFDEEGLSVEDLEAEGVTEGEKADEVEGMTEGDSLTGKAGVAEGTAGGEATVDPLEQIMAEQAGLPDSEVSLDQLADMLLAGQANPSPAGQESVTEGSGIDATDAVDASRSIPENGGRAQEVTDARDQTEVDKADASQNTACVPKDEAGQPDLAAEEVAQAIEASRTEIDAIASAFEEATADLGALADQVCDSAIPPGDSVLPEAELIGAAEIPEAAQGMELSADEVAEISSDLNAAGMEDEPAFQTSNLPSLNMREELRTVRETIQTGLERLIQLLDHMDRTHIEAENRLARAKMYQQAARRAQEASEKLVQARTEAADARAAYESAQRRLEEAESAWEEARRAADDAAL